MSAFYVFAPIVFVVVGGLALMMVDAFSDKETDLASLAAVVLATAGFIALALVVNYGAIQPLLAELPDTVTRYLSFDRMSFMLDALVCFASAICTVMAGSFLREHKLERGEFYAVLLFATVGAMALTRAADMVMVFIGLETLSLGSYAMVAYRRTNAQAIEGGVKYFLLGSFASALLLFGIALLYGATGTTRFSEISESIASQNVVVPLLVVAMALLLAGLAFKLSAVPFHAWAPDAYEAAITPVTAWMAVTVKASVFAIAIRLLIGVFHDSLSVSVTAGWPPIVGFLSLFSMVYGNFAALMQKSVKRMLAYSSIAHAGYMLLGLAASPFSAPGAFSPVLVYLMTYGFSSVLSFGSLIWMGSYGREVTTYDDLVGVGRRHPVIGVTMMIGVLSLMGFPPTAGFFAKYVVFSSAVAVGGKFIWLAVIGVLTSVISAYYYLRVVVQMWMKQPEEGQPIALPMHAPVLGFCLVACSILILQIGLKPTAYLRVAEDATTEITRAFAVVSDVKAQPAPAVKTLPLFPPKPRSGCGG